MFKTILYLLKMKSNIIIALFMLLFSCQPDLDTIETITKKSKEPVESVFDVRIIQSSHASPQIIIKAPVIERYENERHYMELNKGLNVVFYDRNKNPSSRLKANYAISYEDENIFEAKDDVVVINEKNEKLNTEHLIWDQDKEIIYTHKFVRITTDSEIMYGDGFESDERFERWRIKHPRGSFNIEE